MATIASLNVDFTANAAQFMKTADKVAGKAESIDKRLERMNKGFDILKGAGAMQAAGAAAEMLGKMAIAGSSALADYRAGLIGIEDVAGRLAETLPLLGKGMEAGRGIGNLFFELLNPEAMAQAQQDAAKGLRNQAAGDAGRQREAMLREMAAAEEKLGFGYDSDKAAVAESLQKRLDAINAIKQADPQANANGVMYDIMVAKAEQLAELETIRLETLRQEKRIADEMAARKEQEAKAQEAADKKAQEANALFNRTLTEREKLMGDLEDAARFAEEGLLDPEALSRVVDMTEDALAKLDEKKMGEAGDVAAVERMSVAGLRQRDFSGANDANERTAKNTQRQVEETKLVRTKLDEIRKALEPMEARDI